MADEFLINRTASYGGENVKRFNPAKLLVIVNILLAAVLVGEIVFHLFIAPNLIIRKIIVESEIQLSDKEILDIAGISGKEYYFSLDGALIQKNLEAYPLIRKVHIEKVFPDSLKVVLYARKPVALAFVQIAGATVPALIDEEGVVYRVGRDSGNYDFPIISGIRFEDARAGMRLPERFVPFLKELAELRESSPALFSLISELRIVARTGNDFEVLLYPVDHRIPVRIGPEINDKLCKYIVMVLDVIDKEGIISNMNEIDFRTGEVVYRTREE